MISFWWIWREKNQAEDTIYQIDGKMWVSREIAIRMIKNLELDGVIVIHRNGTTFLRTSPDKTRTNNLSNTKITTASFNSNRTTPL